MIGLLIAVFACIYFYIEAKKRGEPPFKWSIIALLTFMGPQVVLSWFLVPFILLRIGIPLEDSQGTQVLFGFIALGIGFALLVAAHKRLYRIPRLEPLERDTMIHSLEITEEADGTFGVGGKTFKSEAEATQYATFLKGLMS